MPDEKKPTAKKSAEQQLRPKTPNPVKVEKGGSSGSLSHSRESAKPSKKAAPSPAKKSSLKPPKKPGK
jgi:hypothetical protein